MRKRIEVSFYKNHFRTSCERGTKSFQTSCRRGKECHFEFHVEEKKSYRIIKNSKPQTEEVQSINSSGIPNLVRKRKGVLLQGLVQKKEVIRSSKTLNLGRKRGKASIHQESQISYGKEIQYYPKIS